MKKSLEDFYGPLAWWVAGISLLLCTLGIVFGLLRTNDRASSARRSVAINIDTNGTPYVLGIPLADKNLQSAAFRVIKSTGAKPVVTITQTNMSNAGFTNLVDTFKALTRAGLLSTNSRSGPSPYE